MKRRTFCAGTLLPFAMLASRYASAKDEYPNRLIRLIMPYSAGGAGDIVLRPLIAKVGAALGQPIIIEHKPGGSTIIGTQALSRAAPDGYTISLITDSHSINPLINKSLPYDSFADFAPVSQLVGLPLVLITSSSLPVKTLPELVKYAKANPGKLSYASLGQGGPHHLIMEWFKNVAGIDAVHVPFPGTGPQFTAVMGGHVQMMFVGIGAALQHMNDKTLNVLAVTAGSRLSAAPQLPTIAESGYPSFEYSGWYGIIAPAKTPPEIVARLSQEIGRALRSGDLHESLAAQGFVPSPSTPEEFAAMLRRNAVFYERLMKTANLIKTE